MGRRSINTTKSGKYMNPTDQARKEARKKELKKNKKQRQMVRAAVLKMKDPGQILDELQKIDEMEFNVLTPSPLNEKVLKEKRKKLKETFDRVLKMYDKDEPEKWFELKRQEMEYEKKKAHLISYYESVKHAQSVQVDDIPLPTLQVPENLMYGNLPSQIPLPLDPIAPSVPMKPILKKDSHYKDRTLVTGPPGVPPGPPPDYAQLILDSTKDTTLLKPQKKSIRFIDDDGPPGEVTTQLPQMHDDDEDGEPLDDNDELIQSTQKPTSLQQRMLALSGQNIDEFMKEMEEVHKKREKDRAADLTARLTALKHKDRGDSESESDEEPMPPMPPSQQDYAILEPPGTTELRQLPPPPLMPPGLRPPPLRIPLPPPLRLPPGPPPGLPRLLRPPGPPPGAPLRMPRPPPPHMMHHHTSVLSAAPLLLPKKDSQQGATISAKPQIRNLSADVTRFVPSALRVKRDDKKARPGIKQGPARPADTPKQPPTKDDAYSLFMKEMEGLL